MPITIDSIEDLEQQTALLAKGLGKAFDFTPKNKEKLSNVICYQAGYPNGIQQLKAHLGANEQTLSLKALFSMQDNLYFECDADFQSLAGSYNKNNMGYGSINMNQSFHIFFDELGVWNTNHALTDDDILQSEYYAFISNFYEVETLTITCPRVNKYGTPELCDDSKAKAFFKGVFLQVSPSFDVYPNDTGDDGCPPTNLLFKMSVKPKYQKLIFVLREIVKSIKDEEYGDVRSFLDDLPLQQSKAINPLINALLKQTNPKITYHYKFNSADGWYYDE